MGTCKFTMSSGINPHSNFSTLLFSGEGWDSSSSWIICGDSSEIFWLEAKESELFES